MHPYFHIFSLSIPSYGIVILLGSVLGILLAVWRCPGSNISRQDTFYAFLFGAIGLIIGAKVLYIIVNIREIWEYRRLLTENPSLYLQWLLSGGFVFYGGLLGGVASVYFYCRKYKIPFFEAMDLFAPTIALTHAIGRIGCFLAGCCYGKHTDGPFGVTFRESPVAPNNTPLFPVQLLESSLNFALCAVLLLYAKKSRTPGRVIGLYLSIYAVMRFFLEFLRSDSARGLVFGVSTSQIIGLLILPIGLYLLLRHELTDPVKPECP